jgi:hypothetical protein
MEEGTKIPGNNTNPAKEILAQLSKIVGKGLGLKV